MQAGLAETDTEKTLKRAYRLFKSVVSNLQTQLQKKKEEQAKEMCVLLKHQFTAFSQAYKVLKEHFEESTTTEEVLRNWYTYYGQVFQQIRETREHIKKLENKQGLP